MPTETAVQAYEQKLARRANRQQRRRPTVRAFANLFGLAVLGGVIYVGASAWVSIDQNNNPSYNGPGALWETPQAFRSVGVYVALVALIVTIKNSDGHKVRNIARARRSAMYPGHPWIQYRIEHPYLSHVFVISAVFAALGHLGGRIKK